MLSIPLPDRIFRGNSRIPGVQKSRHEAARRVYLGFREGLRDLASRCVVTDRIEDWREEIPWMTFYFSLAVWFSLALCLAPLRKAFLGASLAEPGSNRLSPHGSMRSATPAPLASDVPPGST